jgi:hypothetical protein
VRIIYRLNGLKVYSVDAIAKKMKDFNPNIVAYAHSVYNGKNEHYNAITKSDCDYKKIYSTEDIYERYKNDQLNMDYLRKLEIELGMPNLWLNVYHEREIYPHHHWIPGVFSYNEEELLRWLQATARHIEWILDDCKPDIYLDLFSVSLMREITRRMCKSRGILWVIPLQTRYKDKATITDNEFENIKSLNISYKKLLTNEKSDISFAETEIKNFRDSKRTAYNLTKIRLDWLKERTFRDEINGLLRLRGFSWFWNEIDYQLNNEKWRSCYRNRQPLKGFLYKFFYHKNRFLMKYKDLPIKKFVYEKPFFLFPLTTIPEEAIECRGPFIDNEIQVINTIVKSLPVDMQLIVKEHVTMDYKRPYSFYRKIAKIPKVKVLSSKCNIVELINTSEGVITIGSTVGLEAIVLGKPVVNFADSYYNIIDFVYQIKDYSELPGILNLIREIQPDDRIIACFIQALIDNSFDIPITFFDNLVADRHYYLNDDNGNYTKLLARKFLDFFDDHFSK